MIPFSSIGVRTAVGPGWRDTKPKTEPREGRRCEHHISLREYQQRLLPKWERDKEGGRGERRKHTEAFLKYRKKMELGSDSARGLGKLETVTTGVHTNRRELHKLLTGTAPLYGSLFSESAELCSLPAHQEVQQVPSTGKRQGQLSLDDQPEREGACSGQESATCDLR